MANLWTDKKNTKLQRHQIIFSTQDLFYKIFDILQVLAKMWHPDKNSGDKEAEMKFQMLTEAKDILCNPEKRVIYDKWRNSGLQISYKNFIGMKDSVVSK